MRDCGSGSGTALDAVDLDGRPAPPIPAIAAAPPADHPALLRWRAAVGPVRFAVPSPPDHPARPSCEPVAAAVARSAARSSPSAFPAWPLTVAAWNTHVGGGALGALWDRLARGRRRGRPTVLLLQETFAADSHIPPAPSGASSPSRIAPPPPGEPRTDIVAFARARGLSLLYVPSMRNGGGDPPEDRGNAILANLPLSLPGAIELPFERQRRVAATATVSIGHTTVALCSLHLDNRAPWIRAWRTLGPARTRQMAALLRVFPATADPESPTAHVHILGGDLNTWVRQRREGAWRLARKRFPDPKRPDRRPTHKLEFGGLPRISDHLMFLLPPGVRCEYSRLDSAFGSDHYPLVGTLQP